MSSKPKIYVETSCFSEIAKHKIGTGNPARNAEVAALKQLLEAAKRGEVDIFTATLTIAECQHAEEPSSDGMPSEEVKQVLKDLLTSGQYVVLVQDTILVAERARNLRWVHGICLSGPDSVHAASAMEMSCDEFLSFDLAYHKNKAKLDEIAVCVHLPTRSKGLPPSPVPPPTPPQSNLFDLLLSDGKNESPVRDGPEGDAESGI